MRNHNGILLLSFQGILDRNAAEKLRDVLLVADVDVNAEGFDEDDFHIQQLLGCRVVTESGTEIGLVTDVVPLPGQDLLAVDNAGKEILIPFVRAIVPTVDVKNKLIIVVEQEGLLDVQ